MYVCTQVGLYDPYSDDPRLAIHKLCLCALSETLIVGGTAGQVIVMQFEREPRQQVSNPSPFFTCTDRDLQSIDVTSRWREDWQSATAVNSTLVVDPTIRLPGFDLH